MTNQHNKLDRAFNVIVFFFKNMKYMTAVTSDLCMVQQLVCNNELLIAFLKC